MGIAKFSKTDFRLVLCIAILFALFAQPQPAKACSCLADVTIEDNFALHDAVFTGKAVRLVDNYAPIFSTIDYIIYKLGYSSYFFNRFAHNDEGRLGFTVFFKVLNSWKGTETSFIKVNTGRGGGDCGYSFLVNKEYLVYASYAYGIPDNYWIAGTCSRIAEVSNAAEDLNYLNKLPVLPLRISISILWTEKDTIVSTLLLAPIVMLIFLRRRQLQK